MSKTSTRRPGTGYASGWDGVFARPAPTVNLCACMGPTGGDPHCPCEMDRRGLVATDPWTPEKVAELRRALAKMYGWDSAKTKAKED